jgi:hypothetical protein
LLTGSPSEHECDAGRETDPAQAAEHETGRYAFARAVLVRVVFCNRPYSEGAICGLHKRLGGKGIHE